MTYRKSLELERLNEVVRAERAKVIELLRENEKLREALGVYADPRHWGVHYAHTDCLLSWIGPGAVKSGVPDAMETAREALRK